MQTRKPLSTACWSGRTAPSPRWRAWNKDYPDVLGSPETVKGKTFLTTTVSVGPLRLRVLGLTEKDIVIKNMD